MDITQAAAAREPLERIYDQLLRGEGDDRVLIRVVERRSELAERAYTLGLLGLAERDLLNLRSTMAPVLDEPPVDESGRSLAEQEFARVQIAAIDRELARREDFLRRVEQGELETPARNELSGWIMAIDSQMPDRKENTDFYADFQHVVSVIERARRSTPAGALRVAQVLREIDTFPAAFPESAQIQRWIRAAMALELMTRESAYGGVTLHQDKATLAEAQRARRLFYALDRQDHRYEGSNWPLDLSGVEIADAVEGAYKATFEFARDGHPMTDLQRYVTPTPREERGRPEPHAQIVPEARARDEALALGGVPDPMVFAVSPVDRTRSAREIWTHGIPPIPPNQSGHILMAARADSRVRWGAGTYPLGFLCAVALRPREILHLRHPERPEDDRKFDEITRRASSLSRVDSTKYVEAFRELLADSGYRAVQRWDKGGQLIVQDVSCVRVLRESVPPFQQPDRPVRVATTTVIRAPRQAALTQGSATPVLSLENRLSERGDGVRRS
jgi:hypothetical protein